MVGGWWRSLAECRVSPYSTRPSPATTCQRFSIQILVKDRWVVGGSRSQVPSRYARGWASHARLVRDCGARRGICYTRVIRGYIFPQENSRGESLESNSYHEKEMTTTNYNHSTTSILRIPQAYILTKPFVKKHIHNNNYPKSTTIHIKMP